MNISFCGCNIVEILHNVIFVVVAVIKRIITSQRFYYDIILQVPMILIRTFIF